MIFNNKIDIFEENIRLKKEIEHETKLKKEWRAKYYELDKRLKEVEKKLNQLLNPNTPSSGIPPFFKPTFTSPNRQPKGTKPRGKPKNSNGGTKEPPDKIDETIEATATACPYGHTNIEKIDSYSKIIYEINQIRLKIIEGIIVEYRCKFPGCNVIFCGTHPNIPKEGLIGPNLQALISELKHNFAGSYEKISDFLYNVSGNTFSPQGFNDSIHRTAKQLKPSYNQLENELRNSGASSSDETSWPVNGKKWWLWLFVTASIIFVTIDKSRGRKVITRIFGNEFEGVISSDCLNVYNQFAAAFQKCWAHLLRRTHFFAEKYPKKDIKNLHKQLTNLFDEVNKFLDAKPSFEQRVWASIMYNQKLNEITDYKWKSKEAKSVVANHLKKYKGQWLVPIIISEVEMTNNKTERGIRSVIPARKLLGGHRTEQGAEDFAIIETHRQTWKLRKESPYQKMVEFLRQQNRCLIFP